jgi:HD-like signal output (HDOD) protein
LPGEDVHDCFIAGLLHDFGKVVVAQFMPTEFRRAMEMSLWQEVALHLTLAEVIGVDHAAIGAMLAEKWRFAPDLVETIRFQHEPQRSDTGMMASVVAANQISKALGFDFGGSNVAEELCDSVALRLGGSLDVVKASLGKFDTLLQEARLFSKI